MYKCWSVIGLWLSGLACTAPAVAQSYRQILKESGEGRSKLIRQIDGKLLFVSQSGGKFYSSCLMPNGDLDDGYKGPLTSKKKLTALDSIHTLSASIDKWGKLLIGGSSSVHKPIATYVRLHRTGELDSEYFDGGIIKMPTGDSSVIRGICELYGGRAIAAICSWQNGIPSLVLARRSFDGSPDVSFGNGGLRPVSGRWSESVPQGMVKSASDEMFVLVSVPNGDTCNMAVLKLQPDGTPDTKYGQEGWCMHALGKLKYAVPRSAVLLEDGKLVVAGVCNGADNSTDFFLCRLLPDGTVDNSFGQNGLVTRDVKFKDRADDIDVLPDGSLLLSGVCAGKSSKRIDQYMMLRFSHSGEWVKSYGLTTTGGGELKVVNDDERIVSYHSLVSPRDEKIYAISEVASEYKTETLLSLHVYLSDLALGLLDVPDRNDQKCILPAPVKEGDICTFDLIDSQSVTAQIQDVSGKVIETIFTKKQLEDGEQSFPLHFPKSALPGYYKLVLTTSQGYKIEVKLKKDK